MVQRKCAGTAWHGRTLPQSCPYVPGGSTTGHQQGQGQQQPRVPSVLVATCGAQALLLLFQRGAEPPVKGHP